MVRLVEQINSVNEDPSELNEDSSKRSKVNEVECPNSEPSNSDEQKGWLVKLAQFTGMRRLLFPLILSGSALSGCASNLEFSPSAQLALPSPGLKDVMTYGTAGMLFFYNESKNSPEIPKHINYIIFEVVTDGQSGIIILNRELLSRNPHLRLNGYIIDVLVYGEKELKVSYAHKEGKPIRKNHKDGKFYRFAKAMPSLVGPWDIEGEINRARVDPDGNVIGHYYLNSRASTYAPLNIEPKHFALTIEDNGHEYLMPIEEVRNIVSRKIDETTFSFEGVDREKLMEMSKNDKIDKVHKSAMNMQKIFGGQVVPNIQFRPIPNSVGGTVEAVSEVMDYGIIDLETIHPVIVISSDEFNSTDDEMVRIAEHELIHYHLLDGRFKDNPKMREIFADLKDYSGEDKKNTMEHGWSYKIGQNVGNFTGDIAFFEFINDGVFIEDSWKLTSGQPHNNIGEFCTSFFLSLMYIENLEYNLSKMYSIANEGSTHKKQTSTERWLTQDEKTRFINHYITIINVMIEEVDTFGRLYDSNLEEFLREKLEYVENLKEKLENQNK